MKDLIRRYKLLEDASSRRRHFLSLKMTNPKPGVEAIHDRLSLLQEVMESLRYSLRGAKRAWAYKVSTMNGLGWEKDKAPIEPFRDDIARFTGKLRSTKGEISHLKDFIHDWEKAQDEISDWTQEPKPLMYCNTGKMRDGVLHSWDRRLVIQNKKGVWVFKDDPFGETLEEYRERIRKEKMKVNADKEKAALEFNKANPAVMM